jgi:hypothetical protein
MDEATSPLLNKSITTAALGITPALIQLLVNN